MKNKKMFLVLGVFIILLITGFLVFFMKSETSIISEEEIMEIVQTQYEGSTVQSVQQQAGIYIIVIDHQLGEYELTIDAETREITSLRLINLHEEEKGHAEEPQIDHEEPVPSMLSEQEAIEIALREVEGQVENVQLEVEDGIVVYEIEIEVDDDNEATIMINAYTGQILSVTWD
ncbi:PepSY domain-containing protein [Alkalihalobacterium alkalinitrilicum]|uniref:PepSY domain-containing protein n=1 Tax=Alkalihalobacterium alkalinitrilicum TaxID=427920 RepID=UPI000995D04D|nr:PepSY domain-containing protein [Alkalihalobacterium alkalinitrilicum]